MIIKISDEDLAIINQRLIDRYGRYNTNQPFFRLVWANDQYEKRWMTHTDEGMELIHKEVREVPKYWDKRDRYVLEGLQEIPPGAITDLTRNTSYEPMWTFQGSDGNYLLPRWDAIIIILESVKRMQEFGQVYTRYQEPSAEEVKEIYRQEVDKMEKELFGNETLVGDSLAYGGGVTVPNNYQSNKGENNGN